MATEQPKARQGTAGKTYGLNWNLNVAQTWTLALRIGRKERLTDLQILDIMKREFPLRKKFERVSQVRSYYNYGVKGYGYGERLTVADPRRSFAFDEKGKSISDGRGRPRKGQEKNRHLYQPSLRKRHLGIRRIS